MNLKAIVTTSALLGTVALGSVALANQPARTAAAPVRVAQVSPVGRIYNEKESNHSVWFVYRHLDGQIAKLNSDQRDYGGYRRKAVDNLMAAKQNLRMAIDWDKTHTK